MPVPDAGTVSATLPRRGRVNRLCDAYARTAQVRTEPTVTGSTSLTSTV